MRGRERERERKRDRERARGRTNQRENHRERERQTENLRERERQYEKRKERGSSSVLDHQGVKAHHHGRSEQGIGGCDTEEDDQHCLHADRHEGQWTQVTSRRKASSKSASIFGRGREASNVTYQGIDRGRSHRATWRDRHDITSFYFSHFPDEVHEKDLWKKFQEWGKVMEVFIPQKRNKHGHRYGFVRFKGVDDVDRMERRLDNNIYLQGRKLFVNKPMFQRGEGR